MSLRGMRNLFFCGVVCALLVLPAVLLFAQKGLDIECPEWLSGEKASYLAGGDRGGFVFEAMTVDGFASGHFQSELEGVIEVSLPCRDSVLLTNGALQYRFIEASNVLFGWECSPTFYGSERLYVPKRNVLVRMPERDKDALLDGISRFGLGLSTAAAAHPDKQFVVVMPDTSETSDMNPASRLVSDPLSSVVVAEVLNERLAAAKNVSLVAPIYDDMAAYLDDYYSTDHHWNGFGAYKAYLMSEEALGQVDSAPLELPVESALDGLVMNGSLAREGLMLLNESVHEPIYDTKGIVIEQGVVPALMAGDLARADLQADGFRTEFDFYHVWYGPSLPNILKNSSGTGRALLVCDSFGSAFRWPLGAEYASTAVVLDLYGSEMGNGTLEERIDESDADIVYLNASAYNISRLLDRYPRYFNE